MFTLQLACPVCDAIFLQFFAQEIQGVICPGCQRSFPFPKVRPGDSSWLVVRDKHKVGPFGFAHLQELARSKQLQPQDTLWQPDEPHWIPAQKIQGLFSLGPESHSGNETPEPSSPSFPFPPCLTPHEERIPSTQKGNKVRPNLTLSLGDFQILKKIGFGGMGAVYLAQQHSQNRKVALKILAEHLAGKETFVDRFYREAQMLGNLNHPNIVAFYGLGEERGLPFFAMEFIEGIHTATIVEHKGKLDIGDALYVTIKCVDALRYALGNQVIHRDIKPENILITNLGYVKIADLGLAKTIDQDAGLTDSGSTMGTPKFMAPEQARNAKRADQRSDIFSLGGVLYYLVTGEAPFKGDTPMEVMLAKEEGHFIPARRLNSDVPSRLDLILDKMLAKDPKHRYQNYADLYRDLDGLGMSHPHLSFNVMNVVPAQEELPTFDHVEILIIDDDPKNIILAQQALAENYIPANISVVENYREALAYLRHEGKFAPSRVPNLIILGSSLGAPGSLEFLQHIQADSTLSQVPIVVLAAAEETEAFLEKHGFRSNLTVKKPEDLNQFDELIKSVQGMWLTVAERNSPFR